MKTGYRAACYTFVTLVGVALLVVAFYAGLQIASKRGGDAAVNNATEPTDDVSQTDGYVPPAVDLAMTNGIVVDWTQTGDAREFNFYLRGAWESPLYSADESSYTYSAKVMGMVRNTEYDGDYLVAETVSWDPDSLGGGAMTFYAIEHEKDDKNPILLTKYMINEPAFNVFMGDAKDADRVVTVLKTAGESTFTTSDASIAGLDPVETITGSGDISFSYIGSGARLTPEEEAAASLYPVRAALPDGTKLREFDAWTDRAPRGIVGTFFVPRADGRLAFYDINLPAEVIRTNPGIDWDLGSNYPDGYTRNAIGGCGTVSPTNVQYGLDASLLVQTGTIAGTTQAVYEYKDYHGTDDYTNWQFAHQDSQPSYESFAASHPSFFVQDALGRWIKFTGTSVIPPGECGKPVIYLYPTKTTDLSVTLAPQGGFTKSEPAYGNGWNVTASPNGSLVNKADGITYPYLFWEGRGGYYSAPTNYWVVSKADVHAFLVSTLAKIGLNDKETADFLEFWEPRMQAEPFYKIGFHGTSVMNQIAPLTVSQTPDTLLRVLMDYQGLSAPIPSNPPTLPATPVRKGFTVIEWGGVIR